MAAFDQEALTALLEQQRYEGVAPQLDEDELKVVIEAVAPALKKPFCICFVPIMS